MKKTVGMRERYAIIRQQNVDKPKGPRGWGPWMIHDATTQRTADRPEYTHDELKELTHWLNDRYAGYPSLNRFRSVRRAKRPRKQDGGQIRRAIAAGIHARVFAKRD